MLPDRPNRTVPSMMPKNNLALSPSHSGNDDSIAQASMEGMWWTYNNVPTPISAD
jgi:hypothetical protein